MTREQWGRAGCVELELDERSHHAYEAGGHPYSSAPGTLGLIQRIGPDTVTVRAATITFVACYFP